MLLSCILGCREGFGELSFDARADQQEEDNPALPQALPEIGDGEDWSMPDWVQPSAGAGLVGDTIQASANISVRALDLTWRQLNPADGVYSQTQAGSAEGIAMASLQSQLSQSGPFWLRIWTSGVDWAPPWVATKCAVSAIGTDYTGQDHLPIWDACVWAESSSTARLVQWNLRANPDLRFVQVPGAFAWCEFDLDLVQQAADNHGLTQTAFNSWFQQAMAELVSIANGENADPADDRANLLVFTGRDYPEGCALTKLVRRVKTASKGVQGPRDPRTQPADFSMGTQARARATCWGATRAAWEAAASTRSLSAAGAPRSRSR